MSRLQALRDVLAKIEEAETIFNSEATWEFKYDIIFDMGLWQALEEVGIMLDYCDPDTSYEEDVTAYMTAVSEVKEQILKLFEA
jgi:hypothetical protein